ncbi:hypothetical protein AB0E69_26480 [Kribbella sp. NPDC026611]|uniref:hypothetical protein n=1 Tax=Kribbella sp. NPDC026611 TaxID=3154911 RepID=UPI0033D69509
MNTQLTPPPEHELRPATRERQRDELIGIVDHESAQAAPRRRFIPLAAAAAVVAVAAGLTIGVPALRGHDAQPSVSGAAGADAAKPAIEPLTATEKRKYVKECDHPMSTFSDPAGSPAVADEFKWVKPPADTHAVAWVVLSYYGGRRNIACGFDAKGHQTGWTPARRGETQSAVVQKTGAGNGTYARDVARITIAIGTGPATEAILRNGFFFAPMKFIDTLTRPAPDSAPKYTVRGYDANGKLIYSSPKTYREEQALLDGCFTNPEGTKVVFVGGGRKDTPPVSQCRRGVAWNW